MANEMDPAPEDGFSAADRALLRAVLDAIIPSRPDAGLVGAGELGMGDEVERALRALPDLHAMIREGLRDLDAAARRVHGCGFTELAAPDKVELLQQQGFMLPLTMQAYVAYYRNPRVLDALGLPARAPHPQGHEMDVSDLSLLDDVRGRRPLYRRAVG
jgi:hypothetical protein